MGEEVSLPPPRAGPGASAWLEMSVGAREQQLLALQADEDYSRWGLLQVRVEGGIRVSHPSRGSESLIRRGADES
jgi:hypothetical protein